jgi:hypothetical protein
MYHHMCEDEETKEDPEELTQRQNTPEPVDEEQLSDEEDEFNSYVLNLSTVQECYATPSALSTMSQVQYGEEISPLTLPL